MTIMKTLLALAAVLALSGTAFAGNTVKTSPEPAATCIKTKAGAKLDCTATQSLHKARRPAESTTDTKDPRLGISINPWIMPSTF